MSAQAVGLQRNTLDQYYTKSQLAQRYVNLFIDIVKPTEDYMVIEPSAGSGSFSDVIKSRINAPLQCYDIDPKKDYIIKTDFLELDISLFDGITVHVIGNPPFGRQSSLAKKFIKKCCEFCSSISFILPKSFKKPSFYKTFSLYFHKVYEEDCPVNSFMVNDKEYDVPCVFQIWLKKDTTREEQEVEPPLGFKYVSKEADPHVALRRVGFYAGKAFTDCETKSQQSHYFIQLDNEHVSNPSFNIDHLVNMLNNLEFEFNNTVGARSISKPEFTKVINEQIHAMLNNTSSQ
jgi:predicted RNA methylase